MHGEIIAIGDELVSGRVLNTTSGFAARRLFEAGYEISRITVIGDDPTFIKECLISALGRSRFVLITGGLGPTTDDITNEVVAKALGKRLVKNEMVMSQIRKWEKGSKSAQANSMRERMAMLPEGAEVLNPTGCAAGYLLIHEGVPLFFLPGVPEQLKEHVIERVVPRLRELVGLGFEVRQKTFKVFGLSEVEINLLFEHIESGHKDLRIGYYPNFPEVHVTVTVRGTDKKSVDKQCRSACDTVERLLGDHVVAIDSENIESVVGRLLLENKESLAVAESCTGGLLGKRITSVPGSSKWFDRGFITYSNRSKEELLGVSSRTLEQHGAVSAETAIEMAQGARSVAGVDYSLSITGIAGPTGGTPDKPVGTVFIGLSTPDRTVSERFLFPGDRKRIRAFAAETALDWLRRYLRYGSYIPGYRPSR